MGEPVEIASRGSHPGRAPAHPEGSAPNRSGRVEEKAGRAAKAKLTREVRHSLGSKQKLEVQTVGTPTVTITTYGTAIIPQVVGTGTPAENSPPAAPLLSRRASVRPIVAPRPLVRRRARGHGSLAEIIVRPRVSSSSGPSPGQRRGSFPSARHE